MLLPPSALCVSVNIGKNIRPHKALKMGLVDQLVDPASLEAVAVEAAVSLAAGSLKAKRRPKSMMNKVFEDTPMGRAIVWKKVGITDIV